MADPVCARHLRQGDVEYLYLLNRAPYPTEAFIAFDEKLLNSQTPTEMVMFMDGVHPTHQSRATGCWTKRDAPPLALATNSAATG